MNKENMVIGIVGGMGSYATVDFFKRIIDAFPGEKEWDRPRVLLDNYCTLPSRVRAILYGERREELVEKLSAAVKHLVDGGANRLVVVCNTCHVFLPDVFERVPEAKDKVVHIIEACGAAAHKQGIRRLSLVASEGTIDTKIYPSVFEKYGVEIDAPTTAEYAQLREFIEAVKQNKMDRPTLEAYAKFVNSFSNDTVILGCTEIPIIHKACLDSGLTITKNALDPLQCAIDELTGECGV